MLHLWVSWHASGLQTQNPYADSHSQISPATLPINAGSLTTSDMGLGWTAKTLHWRGGSHLVIDHMPGVPDVRVVELGKGMIA